MSPSIFVSSFVSFLFTLIPVNCYLNLCNISYYSALYLFFNNFTPPSLYNFLVILSIYYIFHLRRPGNLNFEDLLKTAHDSQGSLIDSINTSTADDDDMHNMRIESIVSTDAENSIIDMTKSNSGGIGMSTARNSSNCRTHALYEWWVSMQSGS